MTAVLLELILLCGAGALILNFAIKGSVEDMILTPQETESVAPFDCILVLGAGLRPDGSPSDMLGDRLSVAVDLYKRGVAPKLLMSGDHTTKQHDEVAAMKNYAVEQGVPSEDVFRDHAGVCTYDSIYRAKEIFGAERILIVTQEYHLYRALYIAKQLGVEACGVSATLDRYSKQTYRDLREVLARVKDFFLVLSDGEPRFLGDPISLKGDGNIT